MTFYCSISLLLPLPSHSIHFSHDFRGRRSAKIGKRSKRKCRIALNPQKIHVGIVEDRSFHIWTNLLSIGIHNHYLATANSRTSFRELRLYTFGDWFHICSSNSHIRLNDTANIHSDNETQKVFRDFNRLLINGTRHPFSWYCEDPRVPEFFSIHNNRIGYYGIWCSYDHHTYFTRYA